MFYTCPSEKSALAPIRFWAATHIQRALFIASILFPLSAGATDAAEDPTSSTTVRLKVAPETVLGSIPDGFIGFGYETSAVAREGFFSATNTHMVQLYRTLGTNGLVRIGGIIGDHTRFEPDGTPAAHAMNETTVINKA